MKKILVTTLFIAGFAMLSQAQQAPATKQENKKIERKQTIADLHLSADQKKQLRDVTKEFKEKSKAIKDNQSLSKQQKKAQFETLRKQRLDKMNTFLTPEQVTTLNEKRKAGKHGAS